MSKKALLIICDGWGFGNKTKSDAISSTSTPYWDYLLKNYQGVLLIDADGINNLSDIIGGAH